jgi:phage terminase large subunit-like protein
MDTLRYGFRARSQPLFFLITTAGVYDRQHICWEEHDRAEAVLAGTVQDDRLFAYIRAAGMDEDWTDPSVWEKANPSLGVTIAIETLAAECKEAQETPRLENVFRRYTLSQWTEQAVRWLPMEKWEDCGGEIDTVALKGRPCWGGLDISSINDLTAWVMAFPDDDGLIQVICRCWAPAEAVVARERRDGVTYTVWEKQGCVELIQGPTIDQRVIRQRIVEDSEAFEIQEIAYDPTNAWKLATELQEEDGLNMLKQPQSTRYMNEPCKIFERLVLEGLLRHGDNPVLHWAARNVTVRTDAALNMRPDKEASTEKIDPIVAAIMAVGRAALPHDVGSIYDDEDAEVLTV